MMASVLLVVGFIGMIEAVTISAKMMDSARRETLATQILNHEIEKLRFKDYNSYISTLPTASTSVAIDLAFWPAWQSSASYGVNSVVAYGGLYYRCITAHSGQLPTNTAYWTATVTPAPTDIVVTNGATYSLARTVSTTDPVANVIKEVNFTVTWVVKTSRRDSSNSQLSFTYSRSNSAWYGKYGLNLTYQRS